MEKILDNRGIQEWDPSHGDFINKNAIEDEEVFKKTIQKDLMVKIGLTSIYFLLLIFSFVYFS